jgi:hypothetical protein
MFHFPLQFGSSFPLVSCTKGSILRPCTTGQIHYYLIFGTAIPYSDDSNGCQVGQAHISRCYRHDINKFRFKIRRPRGYSRSWKGGETNARVCRMIYREALTRCMFSSLPTLTLAVPAIDIKTCSYIIRKLHEPIEVTIYIYAFHARVLSAHDLQS